MYILYLLRSLPGLFLLEIPVNLSQYRGSVGIFNNRNFFVQSKFSHFSYLSDNNATNNNTNLTIGLLFLLNKIALVLLLLNLMFVFKGNGSKHKKITFIWTFFSVFVSYNLLYWLYIFLITLSRDVELNPGPKRKAAQTLSIWHWNLNSIYAHNFAKLSLKSLCEYTQIWNYLLVRDIFWFQYWQWKLENLRILLDTLWSPFQKKSVVVFAFTIKSSFP